MRKILEGSLCNVWTVHTALEISMSGEIPQETAKRGRRSAYVSGAVRRFSSSLRSSHNFCTVADRSRFFVNYEPHHFQLPFRRHLRTR